MTHTQLSTYVRGYVEHYGIDKLTKFNTRVEHAEKVGDKWRLTLHKLEAEEGAVRETFWIDEFDVFIVATGHYNAPFIPEIQGAAAWSAAWPDKLLHSSGYRIPEPYAGKVGPKCRILS